MGATLYYINITVVKIFWELSITPLDNSDIVEATTCDTFRIPWQRVKLGLSVSVLKFLPLRSQTLVVGVCKLPASLF